MKPILNASAGAVVEALPPRHQPGQQATEVAVSLQVVTSGGPSTNGLRLKDGVIAVPALASHVRPSLVLAERESRELLSAAAHHDVGLGGQFAAGPAGIQVWSGPFDGPDGAHGSAVHLGSVDWSYDTPARHYVTIYRAMVTQGGVDAGATTLSVLTAVLALSGLAADGNRVTLAAPPARDPFRRMATLAS